MKKRLLNIYNERQGDGENSPNQNNKVRKTNTTIRNSFDSSRKERSESSIFSNHTPKEDYKLKSDQPLGIGGSFPLDVRYSELQSRTQQTIEQLQLLYDLLILNCINIYYSTSNIYFYLYPEKDYQKELLKPECLQRNHAFIRELFRSVYTHPLIMDKASAIINFQRLWINQIPTAQEQEILNFRKENSKDNQDWKDYKNQKIVNLEETCKGEQEAEPLKPEEFIINKAMYFLNDRILSNTFTAPTAQGGLSQQNTEMLAQRIWMIQYMLTEVKKCLELSFIMLNIAATFSEQRARYYQSYDINTPLVKNGMIIHNQVYYELAKIEQNGIYKAPVKAKVYKDREQIACYEQKKVYIKNDVEGKPKIIIEQPTSQNSQPKRRKLEIVTMYADRSIEEVISILLSKLSRETKENLSLSK